jgi:hypothetical protein
MLALEFLLRMGFKVSLAYLVGISVVNTLVEGSIVSLLLLLLLALDGIEFLGKVRYVVALDFDLFRTSLLWLYK